MNVELLNEVDLLDEDKPIAQQKYVCLSFISPENIIKKKEEFYLESFFGTLMHNQIFFIEAFLKKLSLSLNH